MLRSRKIFRPPCVEFWGRVLFQKARCIDGADVVRATEAGAPRRKRKQSRQRAKGPNPGRALSLLLALLLAAPCSVVAHTPAWGKASQNKNHHNKI